MEVIPRDRNRDKRGHETDVYGEIDSKERERERERERESACV